MKKLLALSAGVLSSGLLLAEEAGGTTTDAYDASVVTDLVDGMSGFAGSILTVVGTLVAAFAVFYLIKIGIRIVKGIASSAK